MGFFDFPRVAEPETMDDSGEVEAYSSAATQAFLERIDETFAEHALRLLKGREQGCALDIGTGPGQIVIKLARRLKLWKFIGVDRSPNMIAQARTGLALEVAKRQVPSGQVEFQVADGNGLEFPDAAFDLVMCNSVLHHLAEPQNLLAEIARLTTLEGAILLRDLRRPGRFQFPWHVRWHGRHYSGVMYKLYCDSVRAAYTVKELRSLLQASPLRGQAIRAFTTGTTHLGFERPCSLPSSRMGPF